MVIDHEPAGGPLSDEGDEGRIDAVLVSRQASSVILTLNRPEKLNAVNYAMIDRLTELLIELEQDDSVRAVIMTGAGDRAFSAGADVAEFATSVRRGQSAALREFVHRGQGLTSRLEGYPKPVIAAVNGLAYGAGSEITEAAHLAIASDRAEFCKAEIRLGFPPPFGGSQRLPRLIGRKRALEMILTGEVINATQALSFGLVNRVVPHQELLGAALKLADDIADKSPLAVACAIGSVTRGINVPIDEGLAIEANYFAQMVPTHDIEEGISAFLEKRRPVFIGA